METIKIRDEEPICRDAGRILTSLAGRRFHLEDEKTLQADLHAFLKADGIHCDREVLMGGGYIDMLYGRVGMEVKILGGARQIHRQIKRYCESGQIDHLILITSKMIGMPEYISGVRITVFSLGRAWL